MAVRIQGVCDFCYLKPYFGYSLVLQWEAVIIQAKLYKGVRPEIIFVCKTLNPLNTLELYYNATFVVHTALSVTVLVGYLLTV